MRVVRMILNRSSEATDLYIVSSVNLQGNFHICIRIASQTGPLIGSSLN